MSTKDLIDALAAGDATGIETTFNAAMAERISARLDTMRQEVAQNMFAAPKEQAEENSEEVTVEEVIEQLGDEEIIFEEDEIEISDEESNDLAEKYMGFKKLMAAVKEKGAKNPAAVAAAIGRKKYGKGKFQAAAAAGKKMG